MSQLGTLGKSLVVGALVLGCAPDATTPNGLDPVFDQRGHAAGGHPEIFRFTDDLDHTFAPGEFCEAFAVERSGQNKVMVQVFETHLVIHNQYKSTLTNLETGFAIDDNGAWMDVLHFDELGNLENVTIIGSYFRIVIPGRGIVAQETGIITFDPVSGEVFFEGGPHDVFHGIAPGYCTLLSGGSA